METDCETAVDKVETGTVAARLTPVTVQRVVLREGKRFVVDLPGWKVNPVGTPPRGRFARGVDWCDQHADVSAIAFMGYLLFALAVSGGLPRLLSDDPSVWAMPGVFVGFLLPLVAVLASADEVSSRETVRNLPVKEEGYALKGVAEQVAELSAHIPPPGGLRELGEQIEALNRLDAQFAAGEAEHVYERKRGATYDPPQPTTVERSLSHAGAVRLHERVREEYGAFLSDPLRVLETPGLADGSLSSTTRRFDQLMLLAEDARREGGDGYGPVVLELVGAWEDAQREARRERLAVLPEQSRVRVARARKLLALALNETENLMVAAGYVEKANSLLDGIFVLPSTTRAAVAAVGRLQLG